MKKYSNETDIKAKELDANELEKVSGGIKGYEVTETFYDIEKGETFRNGNIYFVCIAGGKKLPATQLISCMHYFFVDAIGQYTESGISNVRLDYLLEYESLGIGYIKDSEIRKDNRGVIY